MHLPYNLPLCRSEDSCYFRFIHQVFISYGFARQTQMSPLTTAQLACYPLSILLELQEVEQTLQGLICEGLEQIGSMSVGGDEADMLEARQNFVAMLDSVAPLDTFATESDPKEKVVAPRPASPTV